MFTLVQPQPMSELKILTFNVWCVCPAAADPRGLAFISKDRPPRLHALAAFLASSDYDIVCLQELWIHEDYEHIRQDVRGTFDHSRFFHTYGVLYSLTPGEHWDPDWRSSAVTRSSKRTPSHTLSAGCLSKSLRATFSSTRRQRGLSSNTPCWVKWKSGTRICTRAARAPRCSKPTG